MTDQIVSYSPIGIIHTPHKTREGTPIQPGGAQGIIGTVEVYSEYLEGLLDLDGFSHIILLYHFNRSVGFSLCVTPFMDDVPHGVFATRAPKRPNAIGISVVKLLKIAGALLSVSGVDMLDGTPLLDIKPFVKEFDHVLRSRCGWLEKNKQQSRTKKADNRFL
ncbi:MAG TPA: tRNA (N6-threonylcarbamoyladenosine(37)-N6)-methyltransferase TrmO [bacterium]|nr:tRNA (N6-threonylcarbamoyladenosine(37)-N6)-methyltransferase TrmO [bacterium]HPN41959.1 tRNA (N6-threonylcarbamoyladenosine(37)-N6)-methyltransferase TrmO [bacterium]